MTTPRDLSALRLDQRDGLPDALRELLAQYPRDGWAADPGFSALVRFWLDRHMMFRRVLAEMTDKSQSLLDNRLDPQHFTRALSRLGGMFVTGLHEHHMIEDHHYFPKLRLKDLRLDRGFDMLDADHHALDRHLTEFVTIANEVVTAQQSNGVIQTETGRLLHEISNMSDLLDRHLTDEEDLIVPVILAHGAPD